MLGIDGSEVLDLGMPVFASVRKLSTGDLEFFGGLDKYEHSSDKCGGVGVRDGEHARLFESEERGMRSWNSVPRCGPSISDLRHTRSPPIFRARPFATRRPSPRPSVCRVSESSSREKGLNKYGRKALGMPAPVSLILIIIYRDLGLNDTARLILPSSVNLMAFKKTQDISLERSRSSTSLYSQHGLWAISSRRVALTACRFGD